MSSYLLSGSWRYWSHEQKTYKTTLFKCRDFVRLYLYSIVSKLPKVHKNNTNVIKRSKVYFLSFKSWCFGLTWFADISLMTASNSAFRCCNSRTSRKVTRRFEMTLSASPETVGSWTSGIGRPPNRADSTSRRRTETCWPRSLTWKQFFNLFELRKII